MRACFPSVEVAGIFRTMFLLVFWPHGLQLLVDEKRRLRHLDPDHLSQLSFLLCSMFAVHHLWTSMYISYSRSVA